MSCDIVTSWSQYLREDVQTITKRKDLDSTWGTIPIGVRKGLPPEKPDRLPAFAHGVLFPIRKAPVGSESSRGISVVRLVTLEPSYSYNDRGS